MRRFALLALGTLLTIWLGGAGSIVHGQGARDEYEIKAACLFYFFQHVEWPKTGVPEGDKTFVIGILGPDPSGVHFTALDGREVKDRKIVIKSFTDMKKYEKCHVLFVSGKSLDQEGAEERLAAARAALGAAPVLLVADKPGLAEKGVAINILMESKVIDKTPRQFSKLEVNLDAEKRAGLKIDPRLLKLARIVRDAKEKP